jgi:hypothetical protein
MEVQGFPDYLIYQDGRVQNKKTGRILKTNKHQGYLYLNICKNNKSYTKYIHRLIAIHYIPNPNNYSHIDHKDRNRSNNNIDNLRWVTPIQNCQNVGISVRNTSGFKNIIFIEKTNSYRFQKAINGKKYSYRSKTLGGVLARKIIFNVLNKI